MGGSTDDDLDWATGSLTSMILANYVRIAGSSYGNPEMDGNCKSSCSHATSRRQNQEMINRCNLRRNFKVSVCMVVIIYYIVFT